MPPLAPHVTPSRPSGMPVTDRPGPYRVRTRRPIGMNGNYEIKSINRPYDGNGNSA